MEEDKAERNRLWDDLTGMTVVSVPQSS
jgi:hypothetical protein